MLIFSVVETLFSSFIQWVFFFPLWFSHVNKEWSYDYTDRKVLWVLLKNRVLYIFGPVQLIKNEEKSFKPLSDNDINNNYWENFFFSKRNLGQKYAIYKKTRSLYNRSPVLLLLNVGYLETILQRWCLNYPIKDRKLL